MSALLALVVNLLAGLGSLVCLILVIIHLFQSEQTGMGIACIVLTLFCGIGALLAFAKGWMDDLGTVMWAWTGCILLAALTNFAVQVAG